MNTEWKARQWVGGVNQPDEKIKLTKGREA